MVIEVELVVGGEAREEVGDSATATGISLSRRTPYNRTGIAL